MWHALSLSQAPCCSSISLQSPELDKGSWWGSSLALPLLNNCIHVLSPSLPVTELHCFPKFHYMASSLLPGSGLYCQNYVPNLDQRNVKAFYLLYSSHFCNHMKHSHAIPECCRYGLQTLVASVHSQSYPQIFMVDKVAMGQTFFSTLSLLTSLSIYKCVIFPSPPICRTGNKLIGGCSSAHRTWCDCVVREYIYIYIYIYI